MAVPALVRKARRGGSSIEYITILALVVIPIALLVPLMVGMIVSYSHRMGWVIRSPLGEAVSKGLEILDLLGAIDDNSKGNRPLENRFLMAEKSPGVAWMLARIKQTLVALHRDERGAMSVEKVLILAIIALPILIVLFAFRKTIVGWFETNSAKLDNN